MRDWFVLLFIGSIAPFVRPRPIDCQPSLFFILVRLFVCYFVRFPSSSCCTAAPTSHRIMISEKLRHSLSFSVFPSHDDHEISKAEEGAGQKINSRKERRRRLPSSVLDRTCVEAVPSYEMQVLPKAAYYDVQSMRNSLFGFFLVALNGNGSSFGTLKLRDCSGRFSDCAEICVIVEGAHHHVHR